jgi:hypothetical protein
MDSDAPALPVPHHPPASSAAFEGFTDDDLPGPARAIDFTVTITQPDGDEPPRLIQEFESVDDLNAYQEAIVEHGVVALARRADESSPSTDPDHQGLSFAAPLLRRVFKAGREAGVAMGTALAATRPIKELLDKLRAGTATSGPAPIEPSRLLTTRQVARRLDMTVGAVRKAVYDGKLRSAGRRAAGRMPKCAPDPRGHLLRVLPMWPVRT